MSESEIQKQLSIIVQSLGKIDDRLDSLEKNVLDIKLTQAKHDEILQKQTQIIELLSARSINQEAEIKMIKAAI